MSDRGFHFSDLSDEVFLRRGGTPHQRDPQRPTDRHAQNGQIRNGYPAPPRLPLSEYFPPPRESRVMPVSFSGSRFAAPRHERIDRTDENYRALAAVEALRSIRDCKMHIIDTSSDDFVIPYPSRATYIEGEENETLRVPNSKKMIDEFIEDSGHSSNAWSDPTEAVDRSTVAQSEVGVDPSEPTTQLELRLPDGRRLVSSFNHAHTLSAVRCFLVSASPALAFAPFELRTSYANQPITDETLSLKDAGLINSALIIRNIERECVEW